MDQQVGKHLGLAALAVGGEQVDALDASLEDFDLSTLVNKLRGFAVDGVAMLALDGAAAAPPSADASTVVASSSFLLGSAAFESLFASPAGASAAGASAAAAF